MLVIKSKNLNDYFQVGSQQVYLEFLHNNTDTGNRMDKVIAEGKGMMRKEKQVEEK